MKPENLSLNCLKKIPSSGGDGEEGLVVWAILYGLGCQKNYSLVLQAVAVLTLHFCGLINTVSNSAFCKDSMYTPSVEHGFTSWLVWARMRVLIRLGKVQETREDFLEDCLQKNE